MSQEQYPLIKRCFRNLPFYPYGLGEHMVYAYELERELEKAVRVTGLLGEDGEFARLWVTADDPDPSHTALLIGIEPIQKDTAESLLRQLANQCERMGLESHILSRARKLLERKP